MKPEFIIRWNNKDYILYAGLLDLAHARGLFAIRTEPIQFPTEANGWRAIVKATVGLRDPDGTERYYDGHGDADPKNVNPQMREVLPRMAETRAKARALRDALNIGALTFEELSPAELPRAPDDIWDEPGPRAPLASSPARRAAAAIPPGGKDPRADTLDAARLTAEARAFLDKHGGDVAKARKVLALRYGALVVEAAKAALDVPEGERTAGGRGFHALWDACAALRARIDERKGVAV